MEDQPAPAISLLGVRIHAVTLKDLLRVVDEAVHRRSPMTLLYANVHTMNLAATDSRYHALLNRADVVYCDGTGVQLAARLLGESIPERMTGADWIHDLGRLCAEHGHSLFLLGGTQGSAVEAAARLQSLNPGLRIAGTRPGFDLDGDAIHAIRASGADILLVGMGSPGQERWIAAHRSELDVPVVWAVGALFDFVSGRIARGPRWMTDHGLEWLCRLAVEPRKLWRRYLIGNPRFLWRVLRTRARRT